MADEPGWKSDPFARHELRYHDGSEWTAHVSDAGVQSADEPLPGAPSSGGSWKDKLKAAAQMAADQGKELAEKGKTFAAEQQAARRGAASNDPEVNSSGEKKPAGASAAPAGDVADQLRRLAGLRDEGILSEEEFAAQKQRLLGG
jgi:hypothetical protein